MLLYRCIRVELRLLLLGLDQYSKDRTSVSCLMYLYSKSVLTGQKLYWFVEVCILTMLLPPLCFLCRLLSNHPKKNNNSCLGVDSSFLPLLGFGFGSLKGTFLGFGTSFSGEENDPGEESCSFVLFFWGSLVPTPHCVHKWFQMFQKFCFLHILTMLFSAMTTVERLSSAICKIRRPCAK